MNLLFIALFPPILWVLSDYFDKFYLNKFIKKSGGESVVFSTSLLSVIVLIFIGIFFPNSISMTWTSILVLLISGIVTQASFLIYIRALSTDDVTTVVPLLQIVPIFSYVLGYYFLGEKLLPFQILAMALIIIGSIVLTLEFQEKKLRIKTKTLFYMILASFISALGGLIFKLVANQENFLGANFWVYAGVILMSALLLTSITTYRKEFLSAWHTDWKTVLKLNFTIELLSIFAFTTFNFALTKAPIALVTVLANGLQPVFILIFGVLFGIFIPKFSNEKFSTHQLVHKTLAIAVIVLGTFLLNK